MKELKDKIDLIALNTDKRLDKIDSELDRMNNNLNDYNADLRVHIAGTIQNRESIAELKKSNDIFQEQLSELKELAVSIKASWKTLIIVGSFSATITGLIIGALRIFF